MVKVHIPRALSVNSLKLQPGGGPGGAGGGHFEVRSVAEVKLVDSVLIQNTEVRKWRSQDNCMNIINLISSPHWTNLLDGPGRRFS